RRRSVEAGPGQHEGAQLVLLEPRPTPLQCFQGSRQLLRAEALQEAGETVGAAQPVAFFERLPEGVERRAILALRARSPQSAPPDGGRQRGRDERCPRRLRHSRLACGGHGLSDDRVTMRFRPARRWSVSLGGTVDALRYWNALLGLSRGDAADRGAEL